MAKNWSDYFLESFNTAQDRGIQLAQIGAEMKFKKWAEENKMQTEKMGAFVDLAKKGITQAPTNPADWAKMMGAGGSPMTIPGLGQFVNPPPTIGTKPIFTINDSGQIEQVGAVPKGSQVLSPSQMMTPEGKANLAVETQTKAEESKKASEAQRNFLIAKGKLRTTMGAFKAMAQQSGGAGRLAGFKNVIEGATGTNPYVKAYQGQLVEAAASLAKLAAPSARVGQEIIAQFKKTLPTQFSTEKEAINQIRFSLHNAFATALGQSGEDYTEEIKNQVDGFVDDLVSVEPLSLETLGNKSTYPSFKNEQEAEQANLPVGSVVFIRGRRAKVK